MDQLFFERQLGHDDGRFRRIIRYLVKADLLILENWGPERMTAPQRHDLMESVEYRDCAGSTLIASQLSFEPWHDNVGEPTSADAILKGLVHNAHRLTLDGPSIRKTIALTRPYPLTEKPTPDVQNQTLFRPSGNLSARLGMLVRVSLE